MENEGFKTIIEQAKQVERIDIMLLISEEMQKELQQHNGEPTPRYFAMKDIQDLINAKK